ncbi:hypothetical protein OAH72_01690 [Gammaproteobacteria bacterium]|nr:hypothetical protein [Porticoccaceae bacterium]MDB4850646.1 hypothetical protein [Gammaproteobacteria bacterium]
MAMETTRSIQEIDPDIKRATLPVLQDVGKLYREGALGRVADSDEVRKALLEQGRIAQGAMQGGLGTQNILNQLRNTEGAMLSNQQGALGSARADRGREAGMADSAMKLQQADLAAKLKAGQEYGKTVEGARALDQEVLDSDTRSAERYFSFLGAAPQSQSTTTTAPKQKSGGK